MDSLNKKVSLEISAGAIIKVLLILGLLFLAYLIRGVIVILFVAFILVSIIEPLVDWLKVSKIPRLASVIFIYAILLGLIAMLVFLLISPISSQLEQLRINFPVYWEKIINGLSDLSQFLSSYGLSAPAKEFLSSFQNTTLLSGGVFEKIEDFISNIVALFVTLVITFYLLVEENATKKILKSIVPIDYLPYAYQLVNRIQKQLGMWLRGQLILGCIVFILAYLGLVIIGVKYALILAIVAGFCEFIPYLGPTTSGILAVTLTFINDPAKAILVVIWYIIMQIFQHNIFVPMVMRKAVGLNPVISICALLIGATLGGFVGVILAIPLATCLIVIFSNLLEHKRAEDFKLE
ncbi:MAG: AI-2E family transporter [Candidatus Parcubacteria bacterium]|nr:AI-2E family transporter [Candidatus Parcubacteria bacterium]